MLTALRGVGDEIGTAALGRARPRPGLDPVDLALPMLLNELAASTVPHVLVLDDYHVLADPRIHEEVEFLVAYLPAVAAAGDRRPRGPAAAARPDAGPRRADRAARRRPAVLRRTRRRRWWRRCRERDLDTARPRRVWERTEGWAAGLQLAGLALRAARPGAAAGARRRPAPAGLLRRRGAARPRARAARPAGAGAPLERLSGSLCDAALQVDRFGRGAGRAGPRRPVRRRRSTTSGSGTAATSCSATSLREPSAGRAARTDVLRPGRGLVRGARPDRRRGRAPAAGGRRGAAAALLRDARAVVLRARRGRRRTCSSASSCRVARSDAAAGDLAGLRGGAERATRTGCRTGSTSASERSTPTPSSPAGAAPAPRR